MRLLKSGTTPTTQKKAFLLSDEAYSDIKSIKIAAGNGTTNFGEIPNGTPMGLDSNGLHRPAGSGEVDGTQASVTTIQLESGEAANLYVDDAVEILSTLGVQGTATLADLTAGGDDITVTGINRDGLAHVIQLTDPSADKEDITGALSWAGVPGESVATLDLTLGYSSSAIDSTIQELADAINTLGGGLFSAVVVGTGSNVVDDAAVTGTLSGGLAPGAQIATKTLTAVDKTNHTVSFSGAVSVVDGDEVRVVNGGTAVCWLKEPHNTIAGYGDDGQPFHAAQGNQGVFGYARVDESEGRGISDFIKADLAMTIFE